MHCTKCKAQFVSLGMWNLCYHCHHTFCTSCIQHELCDICTSVLNSISLNEWGSLDASVMRQYLFIKHTFEISTIIRKETLKKLILDNIDTDRTTLRYLALRTNREYNGSSSLSNLEGNQAHSTAVHNRHSRGNTSIVSSNPITGPIRNMAPELQPTQALSQYQFPSGLPEIPASVVDQALSIPNTNFQPASQPNIENDFIALSHDPIQNISPVVNPEMIAESVNTSVSRAPAESGDNSVIVIDSSDDEDAPNLAERTNAYGSTVTTSASAIESNERSVLVDAANQFEIYSTPNRSRYHCPRRQSQTTSLLTESNSQAQQMPGQYVATTSQNPPGLFSRNDHASYSSPRPTQYSTSSLITPIRLESSATGSVSGMGIPSGSHSTTLVQGNQRSYYSSSSSRSTGQRRWGDLSESSFSRSLYTPPYIPDPLRPGRSVYETLQNLDRDELEHDLYIRHHSSIRRSSRRRITNYARPRSGNGLTAATSSNQSREGPIRHGGLTDTALRSATDSNFSEEGVSRLRRRSARVVKSISDIKTDDDILGCSEMAIRALLLNNHVEFTTTSSRAELVLKLKQLVTEHQANEKKKKDKEEKEAKGETVSDSDTCKICFENVIECVFVACGHMCACSSCSGNLHDCPICRKPIEKVLRVYKS